jgi:hypothetical protein
MLANKDSAQPHNIRMVKREIHTGSYPVGGSSVSNNVIEARERRGRS